MKLRTIFLAVCLAAVPLMAQAGEPDDLVLVRGGTFIMGSPESEAQRERDETRHQVTILDFRMATREVTRKEYRELMGTVPGASTEEDRLPVTDVSWHDAVKFCNARSLKEGLTPAYVFVDSDEGVVWNRDADGYRLPTEAEWEYACRAGTSTPFSTGGNITVDEANYYGTYPYNGGPGGRYRGRVVPAGSFPPTSWGLYDMHGNVWEWCWDRYGAYGETPVSNPSGATSGAYRINRGGGWNDFGRHLRSAYRAACPPSNSSFNLGFRLARNVR